MYLFRSRLFAENYVSDAPWDVWKVDTGAHGIDVRPDPEDPKEAVYTEQAVPADALKFVGTFLNGEKITLFDFRYRIDPEQAREQAEIEFGEDGVETVARITQGPKGAFLEGQIYATSKQDAIEKLAREFGFLLKLVTLKKH